MDPSLKLDFVDQLGGGAEQLIESKRRDVMELNSVIAQVSFF